MNHFILLVLCLFIVEIFIWSNYITLINSLIAVIKKAILTILNKNISDHWKENIIPKYSMKMMNFSLQMLLVFFFIILIFIFADNLFSGFLSFSLSINGIIESILFMFSYTYIRKLIFR